MGRLLKHNLIYVVANQVLLSVGSALIVILLARFTDQVTFGELRYLIAVLAIFAFWSLPGISLIINQEASDMTKRDLRGLVYTQFRWGLGACIAAMITAVFYVFAGEHELARAFVVGGILAPVANLYLVPGLILAGMQRFKLKMVVDASIMLVILSGIVVGTLFFNQVSFIVLFYLGAQSVATVLALAFVYRAVRKTHVDPIRSLERTSDLAHGTAFTFLQIPFSLLPAIEKALIFILLGPVALAVFVIAVLPVEHFKSAFRNLMQFYMLPHLRSSSTHALLHWFAIGALVLTLGIMALVLFILYGMPLLFENFEEARHFSLLLVLAALPLPIHVVTINWIAKRQIQSLRFYALLAILTNIVFIGVSAVTFGLLGAIVAKIIYEVFLAGGLLHLDRQKVPHTGAI